MAEYTYTNSAKRDQHQQYRPERQRRPEGQKWQSWAQTLPLGITFTKPKRKL